MPYRRSKNFGCNNKEAVSRYSRKDADNIEPLVPLLPSSRHSSSSQTSSSSHERRVVVEAESDEAMLSSNNICHWIQSSTQKYDDLKADHDELKVRHDQLLTDFHQKHLDKERLSYHIEQLEEENAGFRRKIDELQKRARDHEIQSGPLRNNLKVTRAKLKESADELRKKKVEKTKLLEEIKKLNTRKADLSSSNQNYEARERKMKIDLEKLSSDFEKEKKEKEQLEVQLGVKNEEIIELRESNQQLDKTVHRIVQFVKDDIVQENGKMLMMLIATQEGTMNAMNNFMDKYNQEMGTKKIIAEGWGKVQVPKSKSPEGSVSRAIMSQQDNNEVTKSTSCDDENTCRSGTTAKRGDGDQWADDNIPLKRSRISQKGYDDDGKCMERGEEEQQTVVISAEQQYELPVGASISVEDGDTGNGFHEFISSPSDSDFATASATSSSSSEDDTTRFTIIKKEPADLPEISNTSSATNSISNSYISSGLRSWSD